MTMAQENSEALAVLDAGLLEYRACLEWMESLHSQIASGTRRPCFLLVQHPPVVTMGSRRLLGDLRSSHPEGGRSALAPGVAYVEIDRGGSATAHEPGQIVLYPLLPLNLFGLSVKKYVHFLEQIVIDVCAAFRVDASRDEKHPGVWCGTEKIAALGVRVKDKVTKHGLAFNVTNSLETFSWIVPCGIADRGVTSLKRQTQAADRLTDQDFLAQVQRTLIETAERLYSSYTGTRVRFVSESGVAGALPPSAPPSTGAALVSDV